MVLTRGIYINFTLQAPLRLIYLRGAGPVGGEPGAELPIRPLTAARSPHPGRSSPRMMINDIFTVSGRVLFWEIKILVQVVCSA